MVLAWAEQDHLKSYRASCSINKVVTLQVETETPDHILRGVVQMRQLNHIATTRVRVHLTPRTDTIQVSSSRVREFA